METKIFQATSPEESAQASHKAFAAPRNLSSLSAEIQEGKLI